MTVVRLPFYLAGDSDEFRAVLRLDPCSHCGKSAGTIDHITASAVGGSNHATNATSACRGCNGRKNRTTLLFWLLEGDSTTDGRG